MKKNLAITSISSSSSHRCRYSEIITTNRSIYLKTTSTNLTSLIKGVPSSIHKAKLYSIRFWGIKGNMRIRYQNCNSRKGRNSSRSRVGVKRKEGEWKVDRVYVSRISSRC